jgi:hypothetical protein
LIRLLILFFGICVAFASPSDATTQALSGETTGGVNLRASGNFDDRIMYRIQICALRKPVKDARILTRRTQVPGPFYMSRSDGFYRYAVGRFFSFEDAMRYRAYLIEKGVDKFIFVVAIYQGQQLTAGPDITHSSFSKP